MLAFSDSDQKSSGRTRRSHFFSIWWLQNYRYIFSHPSLIFSRGKSNSVKNDTPASALLDREQHTIASFCYDGRYFSIQFRNSYFFLQQQNHLYRKNRRSQFNFWNSKFEFYRYGFFSGDNESTIGYYNKKIASLIAKASNY